MAPRNTNSCLYNTFASENAIVCVLMGNTFQIFMVYFANMNGDVVYMFKLKRKFS